MLRCKRKFPIAGALLPALLFAAAIPAFASTFASLDVAALTEQSEAIVMARVVNSQSSWNAQGNMIVTHVTLDVIRTLHGTTDDPIVVRVPGGTVGEASVKMMGAPEFPTGNGAVIVFISRWEDGTPKVLGYAQGISEVVRDSRGNELLRGGSANGLTVRQLSDRVQQVARGRR